MKKVILISGGTDGLGRAIAHILSSEHQVIILSPNEEKLKSVSTELGCDYVVCDVRNYDDVQKGVSDVVAKYQRIDVLINNAGIWIEGELDQNETERIHEVLEVNTLGVMYLTKAVIPQMKSQNEGRIINVISQAGLYGKAERSVYTASKWAITGFTKSLQYELPQYGVSVTGFYPGLMETKLFEKAGSERDLTDALSVETAAKAIEFIVNQEPGVVIPELGMKDIKN
jgi:short-subunit dehydrogenase